MKITDLSISFGDEREVLSGFNLEIKPGEIVGLSGPSGSGKSLVAKTITRTLPISASWSAESTSFWTKTDQRLGVTTISQKALKNYRQREVGMIWQDPSLALNPTLTIGQQLEEALTAVAKSSTQNLEIALKAALTEVQLLNDQDRILRSYPHQLSGGQLQRIVIAMAIAGEPQLIVADEPTTALDDENETALLDLLRQLVVTKKSALLLITHDVRLLRRYTQRIVSMPDVTSGEATIAQNHSSRIQLAADAIALSVQDLQFDYAAAHKQGGKSPDQWLLNEINLSIRTGEIVALIGKSGVGKSTLAKLLMGELQPTHGVINVFDGRTSLISQSPGLSLNPRHSVEFAIQEVLRSNRNRWAEHQPDSAALLCQVDLDPSLVARSLPHQLSGGQRQRVAICLALATKPTVLIADETVSALDSAVKADILQLYHRLARENKMALLMITHDVEMAHQFADRVLLLQHGRLDISDPLD
ncbi:ABC transporter ATP-binding protein [Lewinella sp. 4G2]|uniref:ABC transporter ATP-binding protein n=1 Tax=Lewinella sp. 4G2 TaxID=1803372 RepID=UPI0007B48D92|nr:ATP-binding cassette domain-containing protein [Lewinella sp. 4G2]OAV45347.1 hypothetical protein A3850_012970 [Lewinella sp. 4G2]